MKKIWKEISQHTKWPTKITHKKRNNLILIRLRLLNQPSRLRFKIRRGSNNWKKSKCKSKGNSKYKDKGKSRYREGRNKSKNRKIINHLFQIKVNNPILYLERQVIKLIKNNYNKLFLTTQKNKFLNKLNRV